MSETSPETLAEKPEVAKVATPEGRDIYEVSFWMIPLLTEDEAGALFADIKARLEKDGAEIISEEKPATSGIAYDMLAIVDGKRHYFNTGYFGVVKFEGDTDKIAELEAFLKSAQQIIRHLVVKTVRENTLAPKRLYTEEKEKVSRGDIKKEDLKTEAKEETSGEPISEEELDKTIDELVTE